MLLEHFFKSQTKGDRLPDNKFRAALDGYAQYLTSLKQTRKGLVENLAFQP